MITKIGQANAIFTEGQLKQIADATQKIAVSTAAITIILTCLAFSIYPMPSGSDLAGISQESKQCELYC